MRHLIVIAILVAWSACANYATFQEADTLPPGGSKIGFGATATTYKARADDGTLDSITVPAANFWYRRGLIDKLEANGSFWIPLGASIGLKYQLMGERKTAGLSFSVGLDLSYLQISSENAAGDSSSVTTIDTYLPLYLGYRTGPGFAVYASPKFIFRTTRGDDTSFSQLLGTTLGIALGENTTLHLEGTAMYDFDVKAAVLQGGIGIAY